MWSRSTIQLQLVVDTHSGSTYPEDIDRADPVEAQLRKATVIVDRIADTWLVDSTVDRAPLVL